MLLLLLLLYLLLPLLLHHFTKPVIAHFTPTYCTGTKRVVMLPIYLASIILTST